MVLGNLWAVVLDAYAALDRIWTVPLLDVYMDGKVPAHCQI